MRVTVFNIATQQEKSIYHFSITSYFFPKQNVDFKHMSSKMLHAGSI